MIDSPCIRQYPDGLSPALCRELVEKFESDPRKRSGIAHGDASAKKSIDLGLRGLPEWVALCKQLDEAVVRTIGQYRQDVPNFRDVHRSMRDTGYLLQAYPPDGQHAFRWHADAMNRESCDRFLAMIAYLNDVDEGGETEFRAQEILVKPRAGTILWFPPGFEYLHQGRAPISNTKYIVTTFLVYP